MPSDAQLDAPRERHISAADDEGYMLLGLIVAIAILLLWLGVAATNEAFAIRRDRETEAARRADQYVRAIRLYYKKFGHYPGSVEQLENTNTIRFLRRRWIDPLTGSTEWRTIPVGQNKTTPRGFFGEPLAGLATTGAGAPAGAQSPGTSGAFNAAPTGTAAPGANTPGSFGSGIISPTSILGAPAPAAGTPTGTTPNAGAVPGTTGVGGTAGATAGTPTPATSTASGTTGTSGNNGTSAFGSSGPGGNTGAFMGVGTNASGNSILEVNGETTYQGWEFLYDPRVEQLRLKQQLNSGMQSSGAGAFGQSPTSGAFGQSPTSGAFGQPSTPEAPAQPSSPGGFGQPFGSPNSPAPGATPTPTNPGTTPAPAPTPGGDTPLRPPQ